MTTKRKSVKLTKKQIRAMSPRDYTVMGSSTDFFHFNPTHHAGSVRNSLGSRLEKWVLLLLLSISAAAFLSYKLMQNSDWSMASMEVKTPSVNVASNQEEFKQDFKQTRAHAQAYVHPSKHTKLAKKTNKKHVALNKKTRKKKIAKRNKNKKTVAQQ